MAQQTTHVATSSSSVSSTMTSATTAPKMTVATGATGFYEGASHTTRSSTLVVIWWTCLKRTSGDTGTAPSWRRMEGRRLRQNTDRQDEAAFKHVAQDVLASLLNTYNAAIVLYHVLHF